MVGRPGQGRRSDRNPRPGGRRALWSDLMTKGSGRTDPARGRDIKLDEVRGMKKNAEDRYTCAQRVGRSRGSTRPGGAEGQRRPGPGGAAPVAARRSPASAACTSSAKATAAVCSTRRPPGPDAPDSASKSAPRRKCATRRADIAGDPAARTVPAGRRWSVAHAARHGRHPRAPAPAPRPARKPRTGVVTEEPDGLLTNRVPGRGLAFASRSGARKQGILGWMPVCFVAGAAATQARYSHAPSRAGRGFL